MPTIKITKSELNKYANRLGVYRDKTGTSTLKLMVTNLVREAFIEYATKHGCKPNQLELEWTRFNSILQKHL